MEDQMENRDLGSAEEPNNDIEEAVRLFDEREYQKAFDIYSRHAEEGDSLSKCRMGVMYYEGLGADRRPLKAFDLIKDSYDPEIPETVYQLGKCHFKGIGTPENKDLGFEMIISAAENGYAPAETFVSRLYLEGDYVGIDITRSISWLEKAVTHEDPEALCMGSPCQIYSQPSAMETTERSSAPAAEI